MPKSTRRPPLIAVLAATTTLLVAPVTHSAEDSAAAAKLVDAAVKAMRVDPDGEQALRGTGADDTEARPRTPIWKSAPG